MLSKENSFVMKATLLSAAFLFAYGLAACSRTQSADALISEARNYQQKGDDASAQIQLKNVLQKNPDNVEARYLLGMIAIETGDPQSAEKELRRALSLGKSAEMVLPALGKSLLMQNQFQNVLDQTEKVSTQGDVLAMRGNAYLGLRRNKEAKEAFESSLKSDPDFPAALIGLAKNALIENDVAAATSFAEHAVNKNPKNIEVLLFKANLLSGQHATEPALAAFNTVLALKPDNVDALLNKASLEIGAKKFAEAKIDIDAAQKSAPKNLIVLYMQGLLDFSQGKNAEALEGIQKVLSAMPDYMPGVLIAGALQYNLGSMPQAKQYLTKYLAKNPNNLYARKLLVSTFLNSGDIANASLALEPALKDPSQDVELLMLAGQTNMQSKNFIKAAEYFEKASALVPQTAKPHTALGLSKLAMGENVGGVAELEMATTLDTKSPQSGILLIMAHIRLQEFDKALTAANALEKEQPKNVLVQSLKGDIYYQQNNLVSARASFEKALSLQAAYFPAIINLVQLDLREKKPDVARKRLEALLAVDKKNIQAINAMASLALFQKHQEEATAWLERATQEDPESLPAAMRLTSRYLQINEKLKALTLARKLQATHPTDPDMLNLLAQTQFANNDKLAALESFQRLVALLPNSPVTQFKIASVQIALNNPSAASEAIKKALAIQPDYLDAEILQTSLYMRSGNQAQAIEFARKIQKQAGQSAIGYEIEGNILLSQKKPDLAAKAYEQAFLVNNKNVTLLMKLHESLNLAGKTKEADARVNQWFEQHPTEVALHIYLAETYLAQKQTKAAIVQYLLVLRQEPRNIGVLNNLALAYQQEKDPHALETAEKAHQLAIDNPQVMDTLGWLLIEQGDTTRGLPLVQKASNAAPDALDIRYHLALGLLKSGDKVKARIELDKLIATGKNFANMEEAKALAKTI
ncbi:XrtA/PEP-CTERM system TPR-repeat protein PrsT [Glaciimonas sp. GNP009]